MQEVMQAGGEAEENVLGDWMEFVPIAETAGDQQVDVAAGLAAIAGMRTVEPFGTELAIDTSVDMAGRPKPPAPPSTGGTTGAKGGGNFDDYKTKDE